MSLETCVQDSGVIDHNQTFKSLSGMIMQFTNQVWKRIPASHRRHMEFQDVQQEVRLRVWNAIQSYDPSRGAKLSTWVMGTLKLRAREINAPFTDPSRNRSRVGVVLSIDELAVSDTDSDEDILLRHTGECDQPREHLLQALDTFADTFKHADDDEQQVLLATLGLRAKIKVSPDLQQSVRRIAGVHRLTDTDIKSIAGDVESRERAVLMAASVSKSKSVTIPKIQCSRCGDLYPVTDAGHSIDAKTLVCSTCYQAQAVSPATCFAKAGIWDTQQRECSRYCPDREVCALVHTKGEFMGVKVTRTAADEIDDPFAEDDSAGESVGTLTLGTEQMSFDHDDSADEDDFPEDTPDGDSDDDIDSEAVDEDDPFDPFSEDDELDTDDEAPSTVVATKTEPKAQNLSRQKDQEPVPVRVTKAVAEPVKAPAKPTKVISITKAASKAPAPKPAPAKQPVAVKSAPVKAAKSVPAKKAAKPAPVKAAAPAKAAARKGATDAKPKRVLKPFKPQYWTGQSPFRPGTALQNIVDKLTEVTMVDGKKVHRGVSVKSLKQYVDRQKLSWRGVRHNLAKGHNHNSVFQWKLTEADGFMKITFTHRPDAEYKKSCGSPTRSESPAKASKVGK